MQTNELRERLASAFQRDVRPGRIQSGRLGIDATSAYELADIALGVLRPRSAAAVKAVRPNKLMMIDGVGEVIDLPPGSRYHVQHAAPFDATWMFEEHPGSEPVFDPSPFVAEDDREMAREDFVVHRRAVSVNGHRVDPRSTVTIDGDVWTIHQPSAE